jgi:hypothetical protein
MTPRRSTQAGLSLVEISIILSVLALLSGVLAPAGAELISQARGVRVLQDCGAIRDALLTMLTDTGLTRLTTARTSASAPRVELLVSPGPAPTAADDPRWLRDVDGVGTVEALDAYLLTNDPISGSLPVPTVAGGLGWRGAYLRTPPRTDPWGHRYAVNVQYLGQRMDVLVLSAGADGVIATPFEAQNLTFGGDDVAVLVR